MIFPAQFKPPRRTGMIFHALFIVVLLVGGIFSLWYALERAPDENIAAWYLAGIALLAPVPLFSYRAYSLMQARYMLDRDGLRIRWGLRGEDIPMPGVEWIRPANELGYRLHLPFPRWPGSIYGRRATEGLGSVEFLAAEKNELLLVATRTKVYAISPQETGRFLNSFRRAVELGSLVPLSPSTVLPAVYFKRMWSDRIARGLVFIGALAVGVLAIVTSLLVSTQPELSMGYDTLGQPFPPGPSQYLLLLPILATGIFIMDLIFGMYLYRLKSSQMMSYILWGSSILASLLLITAMIVTAL